MKNVIKKTCAIVMMTAILFTAVAPKPVLASCGHPRPPVTSIGDRLDTIVTHKYGSSTCTIYVYKTYRYRKCPDCYAVLYQTVIGGREVHSLCGG